MTIYSAPQIVKKEYSARTLQETQAIGADIAMQLVFPSCVHLVGDMGVGKTTLTKSIIQSFGYSGEVTSPTYNLVQEYKVEKGIVYHMDLYRLEDPSEIEFLALDDLWGNQSLFLIEWPERGLGYLPPNDVEVLISKNTAGVSDARSIIYKSRS